MSGISQISGGGGNDIIRGSAGADIISGGSGSDTLWGRDGADSYLFDTEISGENNIDVLSDFNSDEDSIVLSESVFSVFSQLPSFSAGNFAANNNGVANDDDDYVIYNTTTGALLYDADGNGQGTAIEFARISTKDDFGSDNIILAA